MEECLGGQPGQRPGASREVSRVLVSSASPHLILFLPSFCAAPAPAELLRGTDQGLTPCPP